jgi:hypothetical protein
MERRKRAGSAGGLPFLFGVWNEYNGSICEVYVKYGVSKLIPNSFPGKTAPAAGVNNGNGYIVWKAGYGSLAVTAGVKNELLQRKRSLTYRFTRLFN